MPTCEIEKDLSAEIDDLTVTDEVMALSRQLYAVLTTMLKERPLQLLRSVPDNNGFEAWRVLHHAGPQEQDESTGAARSDLPVPQHDPR